MKTLISESTTFQIDAAGPRLSYINRGPHTLAISIKDANGITQEFPFPVYHESIIERNEGVEVTFTPINGYPSYVEAFRLTDKSRDEAKLNGDPVGKTEPEPEPEPVESVEPALMQQLTDGFIPENQTYHHFFVSSTPDYEDARGVEFICSQHPEYSVGNEGMFFKVALTNDASSIITEDFVFSLFAEARYVTADGDAFIAPRFVYEHNSDSYTRTVAVDPTLFKEVNRVSIYPQDGSSWKVFLNGTKIFDSADDEDYGLTMNALDKRYICFKSHEMGANESLQVDATTSWDAYSYLISNVRIASGASIAANVANFASGRELDGNFWLYPEGDKMMGISGPFAMNRKGAPMMFGASIWEEEYTPSNVPIYKRSMSSIPIRFRVSATDLAGGILLVNPYLDLFTNNIYQVQISVTGAVTNNGSFDISNLTADSGDSVTIPFTALSHGTVSRASFVHNLVGSRNPILHSDDFVGDVTITLTYA